MQWKGTALEGKGGDGKQLASYSDGVKGQTHPWLKVLAKWVGSGKRESTSRRLETM